MTHETENRQPEPIKIKSTKNIKKTTKNIKNFYPFTHKFQQKIQINNKEHK